MSVATKIIAAIPAATTKKSHRRPGWWPSAFAAYSIIVRRFADQFRALSAEYRAAIVSVLGIANLMAFAKPEQMAIAIKAFQRNKGTR
jgi:hypothetical protein